MAVLQKTFANIYQEVGGYLKNDRTLSNATDLAECKRITNDGYLMFLSERDWSFLSPQTSIIAFCETTGTLTTISTVTITASVATFHPAMVGATVTFTLTSHTFTIASVTSTTVAVLTTSAAAETATDTITIATSGRYRLPSDFGQVIDGFSFDTSNSYSPIQPASPQFIRDQWSLIGGATGVPAYWAIQPVTYVTTTGQLWDLLLYPIPQSDFTLYYRYRVNAAELSADADYPIGGAKHALTIQQAALAVAEKTRGDVDGPQWQHYLKMLASSIERDNDDRPNNLGYCGDQSDNRESIPQGKVIVYQTFST